MTDNWHEVINMSDCDKAILAPLLGDRAFRYHPPVFRSTSRPVSAAMHALLPRVCLMALLIPAVFAVLPSYIKPCKKRDPDINECITRSIDQLRDKLSAGIPEFEAPPIEPLYLKQIRLSRGPVGARLDVNLTDLQVSGPSTFKVRDLKADVENVVFTFKVNFEKLYFQGKYQIDARVLLLKLTGEGNITGTFTNYDSDVVLRAHKVYRDNDIYLNFERMKVKIRIGKAHLHLSNLFGGDTVLSAATHDLLNNNNALFLDEITPVLETSLADLFTNVANKITKSFTYKELFPDD
ncbi:protein takeout-like [Apis florea]|uniref:protein takeout-like n=1 Tax=Apis florea TaxID=7463 RepID=UPI000629AADB|nr:protein takeout-like [Apis florea]